MLQPIPLIGNDFETGAASPRDKDTTTRGQILGSHLLTFYDFPAEHWKHTRTKNPMESTSASVRLRTTKTKGCLSRMTRLTMVFKLYQSASKKWRRLDGSCQFAEIVRGVKFKDGEKLIERAA